MKGTGFFMPQYEAGRDNNNREDRSRDAGSSTPSRSSNSFTNRRRATTHINGRRRSLSFSGAFNTTPTSTTTTNSNSPTLPPSSGSVRLQPSPSKDVLSGGGRHVLQPPGSHDMQQAVPHSLPDRLAAFSFSSSSLARSSMQQARPFAAAAAAVGGLTSPFASLQSAETAAAAGAGAGAAMLNGSLFLTGSELSSASLLLPELSCVNTDVGFSSWDECASATDTTPNGSSSTITAVAPMSFVPAGAAVAAAAAVAAQYGSSPCPIPTGKGALNAGSSPSLLINSPVGSMLPCEQLLAVPSSAFNQLSPVWTSPQQSLPGQQMQPLPAASATSSSSPTDTILTLRQQLASAHLDAAAAGDPEALMALEDSMAATPQLADVFGLQQQQQNQLLLLLQASGVAAAPCSSSLSANLSLLSPQHSISAASAGMPLSAPLASSSTACASSSPFACAGFFDSSKGMQQQQHGDMRALAAAAAEQKLEQMAALEALQKQLKQEVVTLLPLM